MVGKFGANVDMREEGRHPWEDHTYQFICACPLIEKGGPSGTVEGVGIGG